MSYKELGNKISERRIGMKMSQENLALNSRLGLATVKRVEAGQFDPKLSTLMKLSNALGIKFILEGEKILVEEQKHIE
jgi:transcriptional regulator with XRE-family HTH domain